MDDIVDDEPEFEEQQEEPDLERLDRRRIRALVLERREHHRARLRATLFAGVMLAAALYAVVEALRTRAPSFLIPAALALVVAWRVTRRRRAG